MGCSLFSAPIPPPPGLPHLLLLLIHLHLLHSFFCVTLVPLTTEALQRLKVRSHFTTHYFSFLQFSCSVVSDSLRPHGPQHTRPPCPSPTPRVYSNSCPLSQWYHPTISSSVVPFSCPQSFPASGSFKMSQFFASSGQSTGVSASTSVPPVNIQDWSPLG